MKKSMQCATLLFCCITLFSSTFPAESNQKQNPLAHLQKPWKPQQQKKKTSFKAYKRYISIAALVYGALEVSYRVWKLRQEVPSGMAMIHNPTALIMAPLHCALDIGFISGRTALLLALVPKLPE